MLGRTSEPFARPTFVERSDPSEHLKRLAESLKDHYKIDMSSVVHRREFDMSSVIHPVEIDTSSAMQLMGQEQPQRVGEEK